jgi:phospholipid transport system substrate-binding protein
MRSVLNVLLLSLAILMPLAGHAEEASHKAPKVLMEEAHDKVIAVLEKEKDKLAADPEYLETTLDGLIGPYIDYVGMGRLMLGKQWKGATSEQRDRFVKEFRGMLARVYGKSIALYDGQKMIFQEFKPNKKNPTKLGAIRATVGNANGLPVDFYLRFKPSDGWKVFDVAVEGIRLTTNYKSSFKREIARVGLDGLLDNLSKRGVQPDQELVKNP